MRSYLGALALFLLPAVTLAADVPEVRFDKYQLANGLDVILVEDHRLPLVAVNLWFHVGPVNEEPGRTGFAHLFEHMMFAGSKHLPRGLADQLADAAGATDANGSTAFDRTNYYDTWPSNQLALALWIHSDRMGYLLDVIDQAALANQQDVVRNERRQRIENRPYGVVEEALYHNLFPKTHPYYARVMGSHADIQAAKLDDVKRFFKSYYGPNNASLVIVGDIDKKRTRELVERYFGSLKRGADTPPVKVETPPITTERRAVIQDRIELERVYLGWLTPPAYRPGDAELDAIAHVLGGGKSSRLYKRLVYEMQIAQDVRVSQYSLRLASIFTITATARPGHTAKELEAAIDAELARLRRDSPDAAELERARNTIETDFIEGIEKRGGLADQLNRYVYYLGDPGYLPRDLERYRALDVAALRKTASEQLRNETRVVIHGVAGKQELAPEPPAAAPAAPASGRESVNAEQAWRAKQPAAGPAPKIGLPVPKSFKLANGLTVILDERHALPIVSAGLVLKSGTDSNPPDRAGLASFTAQMLSQGTAKRGANQIADDLALLGATLNADADGDSTTVSLGVLRKNFPAALEILADVTLHPAFPPEEIERQRAARLASLVQVRENPTALAGRVMAAAIYGDAHPLGYLGIGTEASVKATTRDDLQGFWKTRYVPSNAAFVVSGDIGVVELKTLLERELGGWTGSAPAPASAAAPQPTAARLVLVDKPGAPQTALRLAHLGPARSTPDFPQLSVMNAALGGLFTSRINNNLREAKGYTYGANSAFRLHRRTGAFIVATNVRTDVTAPAVAEILKEAKAMGEKPVDRGEWLRARESQVRSLPGEFETSSDVAARFAEVYAFDLGLDYYAKLPQRLSAVTAAAMRAAAKKYVLPENLVVIAVGDLDKIGEPLRKLGLGAAETRDAEARRVTSAK